MVEIQIFRGRETPLRAVMHSAKIFVGGINCFTQILEGPRTGAVVRTIYCPVPVLNPLANTQQEN